jgi:hypothetical protein
MRSPLNPEKVFKLLEPTRQRAAVQFGVALEAIIYAELMAVKEIPVDDFTAVAKRRVRFRDDVMKFVEALYDEIVRNI